MRSPEWSRQIYPKEVLRVWKIRKSSRIRLMNCLSHSSWFIFQLVGNIIPDTRKHLSPTLGNNVPSPWDCPLLCRLFYRSTFVRRPDVLNLQLDSSPFENIILDGVGYIERTFGLDVSC